jgi:hypothetical protein
MDEYTADAWHDLLGDLDLDECRAAVVAVARRQPFVAASEIRTEAKRARARAAEHARTEALVGPVRLHRDRLTDPRPLRSTIRELMASYGGRGIAS